jgi:hypothetical protein
MAGPSLPVERAALRELGGLCDQAWSALGSDPRAALDLVPKVQAFADGRASSDPSGPPVFDRSATVPTLGRNAVASIRSAAGAAMSSSWWSGAGPSEQTSTQLRELAARINALADAEAAPDATPIAPADIGRAAAAAATVGAAAATVAATAAETVRAERWRSIESGLDKLLDPRLSAWLAWFGAGSLLLGTAVAVVVVAAPIALTVYAAKK